MTQAKEDLLEELQTLRDAYCTLAQVKDTLELRLSQSESRLSILDMQAAGTSQVRPS